MKLLDTSVLVDIDRGGVGERVRKLDDAGRHAISIVSVTELQLGIEKQYGDDDSRDEATEEFERLLSRFEILPLTRPIATDAATIIADLQRRGEPLHDLHDVYIGATARTERLAVLTANVDHFDRMDDVRVIDWHGF
ncbi:type II toxin-antitoxin system VapC family toxin [Halalkalicoccus sp. NIPERK01]|uniref:type II toxin-antitoxin system VapC family toxin n=1 Tax=Halalkalicoccus sp. NIPERK01 TaxID=3053469 RepID=UPI00256F4D7F|nr:type II toxin-antitoxin system VapC family toxin [Halalkalicoccus sp. NIPERK01]MDL5363436.1 type II toxin-antitoxin system VapC family toxin [Halalkalicoccus sp. NIPERK01]